MIACPARCFLLARRVSDKTAWISASLGFKDWGLTANASGSSQSTTPPPITERRDCGCTVDLNPLVVCITAFQRDEAAVRDCLHEELKQAQGQCDSFVF